MNDNRFNVLIVGVGGQGVLLASEIISEVAMHAGLDVKKSEIHGMSQRGGVVSSHIKMATKVYSPVIQHGKADVLLSFEQAEGLRAIDWLHKDGIAIVSQTALVPAIVTSSKEYTYPEDAIEQMQKKLEKVISVPADKMAGELGNPRLVNTILLGVLSNHMPFSVDQWTEAMKSRIKERFIEVNLKAFAQGRELSLTSAAAS